WVDQRGEARPGRAAWACFHRAGVRKFLKESRSERAAGRRRRRFDARAISRSFQKGSGTKPILARDSFFSCASCHMCSSVPGIAWPPQPLHPLARRSRRFPHPPKGGTPTQTGSHCPPSCRNARTLGTRKYAVPRVRTNVVSPVATSGPFGVGI